MPNPGSESATVLRAAIGALSTVMRHFHVEVHHLVEIERIDAARHRHAQRVADKVPRVMVLEKLWILGKHRALVRFFDIGLNRQQSIFPCLVQNFVAHLQRFQVERLGEVRTLQRANHSAGDLLDHVQRIGDQQCAKRRSSDDDQLRRLQQNLQVPMLHQVAGDNRAEHHHNANDDEHRLLFPVRGVLQVLLQPLNQRIHGLRWVHQARRRAYPDHHAITPPLHGAR